MGARRGPGGVVPVGNRSRGGAVSYTHLRAHETVLDLVCRLLLEKKNKLPSLYEGVTPLKGIECATVQTSNEGDGAWEGSTDHRC